MSNLETCNSHEFYCNFDFNLIPIDVHTAASLGDVTYFKKYDVKEISNQISVPNQSGWTPLMYACSRGHSFLVNYLLMLGAKRNSKSKSGLTPLMLAVSSADLATVENVFDFSNLEDKDYRKWTPLFYAVHFAREKCVNFLLERGADVNAVDYQNESVLMKAIKLGRETMVELLINSAENLDAMSYKQESALMLANESDSVVIRTLVKNRHEYLNNLTKTPLTPKTSLISRPIPVIRQSCAPLKQQIKAQLSQIKFSKSFTYSPNVTPNSSPRAKGKECESSRWSFGKKFWSPQLRPQNDVEKFLRELGLEKYWPIFRDEEVDFETLLTLNEENLKEIGITLLGPRKKIYFGIQKLKREFY